MSICGRQYKQMVFSEQNRVKWSKLGGSAKFGERPCLFHILIIVIKNKLN